MINSNIVFHKHNTRNERIQNDSFLPLFNNSERALDYAFSLTREAYCIPISAFIRLSADEDFLKFSEYALFVTTSAIFNHSNKNLSIFFRYMKINMVSRSQ